MGGTINTSLNSCVRKYDQWRAQVGVKPASIRPSKWTLPGFEPGLKCVWVICNLRYLVAPMVSCFFSHSLLRQRNVAIYRFPFVFHSRKSCSSSPGTDQVSSQRYFVNFLVRQFNIQISVFWIVVPYSLVELYRHFRGSYYL